MIKRDDCQYLVLDGMPFIVAPDKRNWVFARTTKSWVLADSDDWDAVYLNDDSDWEDLFSELPELPEGAITEQTIKSEQTPKQATKHPYDLSKYPRMRDTTSEHLGEGTIIGGWPSTKPRKT
jgi:hypothetical protein